MNIQDFNQSCSVQDSAKLCGALLRAPQACGNQRMMALWVKDIRQKSVAATQHNCIRQLSAVTSGLGASHLRTVTVIGGLPHLAPQLCLVFFISGGCGVTRLRNHWSML